jgi:phage shock protein PspC (stress-responsive transcriptional regulator)
MNRTITMNLSGIIFHIEEDAYEKLNKYLATIKGYFNATEGRDEIMGDIESRIAEMLQEKVNLTKQAVLLADIESIIAVMGKPEDFAGENEQVESNTSKQDPAYTEGRYGKRLFRDPDDKMLGGVCSGIANYFDLDPIWIRGAFAISFFAFGSGALLYFVLWMIMPLARTTAEKLQMRGEKVDINNIGKTVNEELNDLKKRVNRFGEEVSSPAGRERLRNTGRSVGHFLGATLVSILTVIGKIVSVIVLILSVIFLTGLLALLFGKSNFMNFDSGDSIHFSIYEISAAALPADISAELVVTALILVLGIPLLLIIYSVVKYLFNIRQRNKYVNYTACVLWVIGTVLTSYIVIKTMNEFSNEAHVKKNIGIQQPAGKMLYLDVNPTSLDGENNLIRSSHYIKRHGNYTRMDDWSILSKEDDHYRLGYPVVDIVRSETDSFELVVIKTSNGFDKKEATMYAKNISYETSQKDSLLMFNSYFDMSPNDKFRAQRIKIILKVPLNKTIFLSKRMERIIFDIDNIPNILDRDMVNRKWIMTSQGLECLDCDGSEATVYDSKNKSVHVSIDSDDRDDNGRRHITIRKRHNDDGNEELEEEEDDDGQEKKVIINRVYNSKGDLETETVSGNKTKKNVTITIQKDDKGEKGGKGEK